MESTALEEKIRKIRLQNEEIKRRYEEVEADKKNAAKLDALAEPVPSEDWPERKEPPEFSAPAPKHASKHANKQSVRKHNDQAAGQHYTGSGGGGGGKKAHNFADGQGPPPDPKYNFLADPEREEHGEEVPRDTERNRGRSKPSRGVFKRRGSGRDWHAKEQWNQQGSPGDSTRPDYEAWRAERNRIDEARISRQRTAEGNWRREWDNDKIHLADEVSKRENRVTLGEVVTRQEPSDNEKLYRPPRTAPRNLQYSNARDSHHGPGNSETNKSYGSVNDPEKRLVIATDRSIKVMLNPGSTPPKSSVMSVKVSPANIAGTGRVGPRQRPRVMYSSQSDAEASTHDSPSFTRQKSAEEKTKGRSFDHQTQKAVSPKSPHPQRRRDGDAKSPFPQRRDNNDRGEKVEGGPKLSKKDTQKSPYPQRRGNSSGNYPPKSPRVNRRSNEGVKNDSAKLTTRVQHQERKREKSSANSVSEESKGESSDDKSNELLSNFEVTDKNRESVPINQSPSGESNDSPEIALESTKHSVLDNSTKNCSELLKQSPVKSSEISNDAVIESADNNSANEETKLPVSETAVDSAILESNENSPSNVVKNDGELLDKINTLESSTSNAKASQSVENSANETVKQPQPETENEVDREKEKYSAENNTATESKEIYGEASGVHEPKNTPSNDIAGGSASNQESINCSGISGVTSNDSGFLELPSNDSIHDVSENGNVETSDFAETSVDSIQSGNEAVENRPIVENLQEEQKEANAAVENIADSSFASTDGTANNSQNTVNVVAELEQLEKYSAIKSEESNAKVVENSKHEIESSKPELPEKDTAKSAVDEETANSLDVLKWEEKDLESGEKAAEVDAKKDDRELNNRSNNESAIVLETPNNIGQQIADGDDDKKLEDGSINESSSVSKTPNDINKESTVESTIAEPPSSSATKKVEIVDEKSNERRFN